MNLGGTVQLNKRGFAVLICACLSVVLVYNFLKYQDTKIREELVEEVQVKYLHKATTISTIPQKVNLKELLKYAIEATVKGGEQVKKVKDGDLDLKLVLKGKTKEGVDDPKTQADMLSHQAMTDVFKSKANGVKVVSEEHTEERLEVVSKTLDFEKVIEELKDVQNEYVSTKDVSVWIDPLDATKEYTENLTQYVTTMACVAVKGEPVIGVVHYPFEKKTFWGWVGKAHSSGLSVDKAGPTDKTFIVSISHAGSVSKVVGKAFPSSKVISAAGAGYKMLEVARKNVTAYVHVTDIKKWDTCAGHAILLAAGGRVTTLLGGSINYSSDSESVISDGLLATLSGHEDIFEKFRKICPNGLRKCE